jgi:hypothetical protein
MSMVPDFLLPETTIREAGAGPVLDLDGYDGEAVIVTLGITRIVEQESLDVSICGSADGKEWSAKPLASFPQKFYCGTYQILVDLTGNPNTRYLRAKWQVNRWGKGDPKPLFALYLFVQNARIQALAIGA